MPCSHSSPARPPGPPWTGSARRALLITGNVVRIAAFCAYPLVHTSWQVVVVTVVAGLGDRLFWTCNARR